MEDVGASLFSIVLMGLAVCYLWLVLQIKPSAKNGSEQEAAESRDTPSPGQAYPFEALLDSHLLHDKAGAGGSRKHVRTADAVLRQPAWKQQVLSRHKQGMPTREIAKQLSLPRGVVELTITMSTATKSGE